MSNALALRRAVVAFKPDVLHSFSRLAYLFPWLMSRLPKVMSYQRHTGGRQTALAARLGGQSLRFTGCSEFICAQGRRAGGTWQAIHNFVDMKKYTFVPSVAPDAPLVFLGRIESIKGADLAIAIARTSGHRLVLAGNHAQDGTERDFWDRKIAPQLGHGGIEWIGEVDDAAKNTLLGTAAALLVPVQWDEPFGIVFVEALACGTPVIACPRGALSEIVRHSIDGFLVSGSAEACEAVGRLHTLSRAACRQRVEHNFSVNVIAAKYEQLYMEMSRPALQ